MISSDLSGNELGIIPATGGTDCCNKSVVKDQSVLLSAPRHHYNMARDLGFSFLGSGGEPTEVVVVDQKFEKQKTEDEPGAGDGEDSMVGTEVVQVDVETEVEFRQPRGSDPGLDRMPEDIPAITGAVGAEADTRGPGQTRRLGPLSGAKPKRPRFGSIRQTPGPRRPPPGAGTQPVRPVTDRFAFEMLTPTYP